MKNNAQPQNEELTRLEILRTFKKRFAGEQVNYSPFAEDRVVRYDTVIDDLDVPEIHHTVRVAIQEIIQQIHAGQPSKVVILAGEAGMGKSHLLNYFRTPKLCQQLGYVLIGNSNHWKIQEFEACLLDWTLDTLLRPSPQQPHLLLDKVEAIAFEALRQILDRPGQLRNFIGRKDAGFWRRQWAKWFGSGPAGFQKALSNRDVKIFRRFQFDKFADFVIDRFLPVHASKPFHRHVLKCLLLYLFPEEREKVIQWLRRQPVEQHFVDKLGIGEPIDTQFKVIDTIQILISLFSPEVSRIIHQQAPEKEGLVFLFAFDQMEGRQELFDDEQDWFKFFGKLSELYNTLPNVFFMFTMTLALRQKLYPKMEKQFQHRIQRDQKYVLREIQADEILAVYRRRILHWLGDAHAETASLLEDDRFRYLPFGPEGILEFTRSLPLREIIDVTDERFREYLDQKVVVDDPQFEYLVSYNELRDQLLVQDPFDATADHLGTVVKLMGRAGEMLAAAFNVTYTGLKEITVEDTGLPAIELTFRHPQIEKQWIRVYLVRLTPRPGKKVDACVNLLYDKLIERNFLWLVRPDKIDLSYENRKPGQVYAHALHPSEECTMQAMLRLLDKRDRFKDGMRHLAEQMLHKAIKGTYVGTMLEEIAGKLGVAPMPDEPAEVVGEAVPVLEEPS